MTDWRLFGSRLLKASPKLKAALGLKDGLTPSQAVQHVLDQDPSLGEAFDTTGLDEDLKLWEKVRSDRTTAAKLNEKAGAANAMYRAAEIASRPGLEAVTLPAKLSGTMGWEETPGSVARELAGGGAKGAFIGGVTDALADPVTALAAVGTGGGSIAANELLKKVGGLALLKQGASLTQTAAEHGVTSPEFREEAAGTVGGLAAGIGIPVAAGVARARALPVRTPIRSTVEAPQAPKTAPEASVPAQTEVVAPKVAPPAPVAPPEASASPQRSQLQFKAAEAVARAQNRLKAAEEGLAYQKGQRGGTGTDEAAVAAAKANLARAQAHHEAVQRFEAMGEDHRSWVDAVVNAQETNGATKALPGEDVLQVFKQNATPEALREAAVAGRGGREAPGGKRQFERASDSVAEALGLPEPKSYAELRENDAIVADAVDRARTGAETVLTPKAIEEGATGVPYRDQARSQGWDIDELVKLHKKVQAGANLTPEQLQRYVKAADAARQLDLGRGLGETYGFEDHAARRAMGRAAAEDVMNLDAEPPAGAEVDTTFDPAEFAGDENAIAHARLRRTGRAAPEPPPPPQSSEPGAPKETPADLSAPRGWSVERPDTGKATVMGRAMDVLRTGLRTVKSELIHKNYPTVAHVVDKIGFHIDDWSVRSRAKFDELKAMGIGDKDLQRIYREAQGGKLEPKDAKAYGLIRDIFDSQYRRASEKDPTRGNPDEGSLAGVAPPEGPYWPHAWDRPEPVGPITPGESFRSLETTGTSKAPSLYKERQEGANSVPILTMEGLEAVAHNRARSVGSLQGGASKPRTPEAYPGIFKALLADEMRKARGPNGATEAEAAARGRLDELQLPDLYEALAKDRPNLNWSEIVHHELVARAADEVVKGRSAMSPGAKEISTKAKAAARFAQLGFAAPLNYYGLSYVPGIAYDAARSGGAGRVSASLSALTHGVKAAGYAVKNTVGELGAAAARAAGAETLSPGQKAFGRSRAGLNLPMRAIAMTDRASRMAVMQALRDVIPTMKHEDFRYTDRSLPMSDPRNIRIAQMELANSSQGLGTLADKLKATGNPLADVVRELAAQYMSPELRQAETMVPRMGWGGKAAAVAGAALVGEGVQDMRAAMRGGGLNLPGADTTEDQKRKPLRSVVATDRDPRLLARVAQNVVSGLPFAKQAIQSAEYGDLPLLGTAPSVALAGEVAKATKLYYDTGDIRALFSLVNAPGFGRDWAKIVRYEQARKKNPQSGLGGVPQNLTLPWKIQAYLDGTLTADQVLDDTFGQGGPTLPLERRAVQHRAELNRKADAKARRKH